MGRKAWLPTDPRLWNFVDKSAGPKACWPYTGCLHKGYGWAKRQGKRVFAHRLAWECTNGPIPDGLFCLHRCDNPPCCNPAHLFLGTQADNNRDRHSKGRSRHGVVSGDQHYLRREPDRATRGEAHGNVKLTDAAVLDIRARWPAEKQKDLAAEYKVSQVTISHIVRREQWAHL